VGGSHTVKSHFDVNNISYYSFYPKSENPMKAVIRHLPQNTTAEDISDRLVILGFDVNSVKQMTATRRSLSDRSTTINLPLFLITLPRAAKS
jgi:patatin-like phospholipase/acyl hydrolase